MDRTFHVIFCPGMVRYLRLAVLSLLHHSEYRYRLVANGLPAAELAELRAFCATSARLEYLPFPTRTVLPHGVLLSLLQSRETGSHFCFVDADVFASAPFQAELERHLAECDVFSSCNFMSLDREGERTVGYGATALETPNGLPLATTFFAVYRQEPLRRVIAETGLGFEYSWREHQRERVVEQLAGLGIDAGSVPFLDTGKLLNILSHAHGLRFRYADLEGLAHIGGSTGELDPHWRLTLAPGPTRMYIWRFNPGRLRDWWTSTFSVSYVLRDRDLEPRAGGGPEPLAVRRARLRKVGVAKFFAGFLRFLVDGTPEPRLEITDSELRRRIVALCDAIRTTWQSSH